MRRSVPSTNESNHAWSTYSFCINHALLTFSHRPSLSSCLELHSPSISRQQFQAGLKTHLFKEAYTDNHRELLLASDMNSTKLILFLRDRVSRLSLNAFKWKSKHISSIGQCQALAPSPRKNGYACVVMSLTKPTPKLTSIAL